MTILDTPDNQRGVFGPQLFCGTVTTSAHEDVALPPNTESLILVGPAFLVTQITVQGLTTLANLPVIGAVHNPLAVTTCIAFVPVSPAADPIVRVTGGSGLGTTLSIVADAGVRTITDGSIAQVLSLAPASGIPAALVTQDGWDGAGPRMLRVNTQGMPYTVPSAPSEAASDHPLNEVNVNSVTGITSTTTILNAPGAGKRYRIYGVAISVFGTPSVSGVVSVDDAVAITFTPRIELGQVLYIPMPLSGVVAATNAIIRANVAGTLASGADVTVFFTVETV